MTARELKLERCLLLSTCRICGEKLKMSVGSQRYGATVHSCPRCGTPYVDPKIVEIATVPERERAKRRLSYAKEADQKMYLVAAGVFTLAMIAFTSASLVHSIISMLLLFVGVYAGINVIGFTVKFFLVFPKLTKESVIRMKDTWYLSKLKACYAKAA